MPKASEVAAELRRVADLLDLEPELVLVRPELEFGCKYGLTDPKTMFLNAVKVFPRPFKKGKQTYDDALEVRYTSDALIVVACVMQAKVCRLIEKERVIPAVYDCDPLLSAAEEAGLARHEGEQVGEEEPF